MLSLKGHISLFLFHIPWRPLYVVITSIASFLVQCLCFVCSPHVSLFFSSQEPNNGLSEDVLAEAKESASCHATEHKETKLEGASLSSTEE